MKTYVRLTRYTLEKEIISKFPNSFSLTIPANLLMYYSKSLAEFIKKNPKPFFIDPMTYIFAYPKNMLKTKDFELLVDNDGSYRLKKSYEKLVSAYDKGLISLFESDTPISASYFNDPKNFERFVKNNITYQTGLLKKSAGSISKYEAILGQNVSENSCLEPEFVTVPYFYFRNTSDQWYNVNAKLSKRTKELCPDIKVFSVICTDKHSLNRDLVDTIVADFETVDGFILFVSDFNEATESVSMLNRLKSFVNRLHQKSGKPILNLYGRFFSALLKFDGIAGISSGLCLLDHRDATAEHIGGRAFINFYIPSVHDKITEQDFKTYLERYNPTDECTCSLCKSFVDKKNTSSPKDFMDYVDQQLSFGRGNLMTGTMEHFLHVILRESQIINNSSIPQIRTMLGLDRQTAQKYTLLNTGRFIDRIISVNI